MKYNKLTVGALAVMLTVPVSSAIAQQRSGGDRQGEQQRQQQNNRSGWSTSSERDIQQSNRGKKTPEGWSSDQQTVTTRGEILRLKKVEVRDRRQVHMVALIETSAGRHGVVDLGPTKQLQQLKLKQGDKIEVRGRPMKIKDRGILMAQAVRRSGDEVDVNRPSQRSAQVAKTAVRKSDVRNKPKESSSVKRGQLDGTIVRTKQVDMKGQDDKQLIVLIETERGNKIPVDLGSTAKLKDAKLKRGDEVRIIGFVANIGDQRAVIAEKLAIKRASDKSSNSRTANRNQQQPSR